MGVITVNSSEFRKACPWGFIYLDSHLFTGTGPVLAFTQWSFFKVGIYFLLIVFSFKEGFSLGSVTSSFGLLLVLFSQFTYIFLSSTCTFEAATVSKTPLWEALLCAFMALVQCYICSSLRKKGTPWRYLIPRFNHLNPLGNRGSLKFVVGSRKASRLGRSGTWGMWGKGIPD